ncbi:hypothetical protein P153DRAFT_82902 [Dothidotthia symphoricarpi CBS 119687]|uniref:Uncharacterized protein n=1 Tax=Dothidotthia symphoricarpi CBS 119687 TaxID=1392245 RepID=A0A6A6A483_9PLEO|nr:uncharacterized protein P153DRAFT_82902 [Dothidotthia symphoricarpi CBS 119687]KAF2125985.1 hypothetical protein P153DRAFT_82902 [Dothidotthia symphoricarpi CBS 119687]
MFCKRLYSITPYNAPRPALERLFLTRLKSKSICTTLEILFPAMSNFFKSKKGKEPCVEMTTITPPQHQPDPPSHAAKDVSPANSLAKEYKGLQAKIAFIGKPRAVSLDSSRARATRTFLFPSSKSTDPPSPQTPTSAASPPARERASSDLSNNRVLQHSQRQSSPVRGRQQAQHEQIRGRRPVTPPSANQNARHLHSLSKQPSMVFKKSALSHVSVAEEPEYDENVASSSSSYQSSMHSASSSIASSRTAWSIIDSNPHGLEPHQISVSLSKNSRTRHLAERRASSMPPAPQKAALSPSPPPTRTQTPPRLQTATHSNSPLEPDSPTLPSTLFLPRSNTTDSLEESPSPSPPHSHITPPAAARLTEPSRPALSLFSHKTHAPDREKTHSPYMRSSSQPPTKKHDSVIQFETVQPKLRSQRSISTFFSRRTVVDSAV